MAYTEGTNIGARPVPVKVGPSVVEYHDSVRWGPIFAGIVVSIVSQLMMSALGASIGGIVSGEATAGSIGVGLGIWAIISLLISLFLGSWVMAASCGPMNNKTAMLNATVMWATTLVISGWLLASGVSGAFGILAANVGGALTQVIEPGGVSLPGQEQVQQAIPDVSAEEASQYAANAAKAGFSFLIGSALGWIASLIGATVGAKKPRVVAR
ncbi:MAG: hypothetical protein HC800_13475 [Phormidesmis sp. RL_2_1]|nr:hypothetical protein [Phormidesmis sp. RL_2_1]